MLHHIRNMTLTSPRILSVIGGLLLATAVQAAEPHYGDLAFSSGEDASSAKEVFATDTPKIYLHAELEDAAEGTKLRADWIAEKTDAAPPNYKIDSVELTAKEGMDEATFTLSKPNAGWPAGEYRVELSINGKAAKSGKFKVSN